MATYTTELRTICASLGSGSSGSDFRDADRLIPDTWEHIFTNNWNTFDPNYKVVLCGKILKHYWMREIGTETVGLFLHYLDARMGEIMPYYNELYKSASYEFNPLHDYEVTHTSQRTQVGDTDSSTTNEKSDSVDSTFSSTGNATNTANTTATSNSTTQSINKYSDTPQGALNGVIEGNYLTSATVDDNSGNQTKQSEASATANTSQEDTRSETRTSNITGNEKRKATTTEDYVLSIVGKTGGKSYAKMIAEYRDTLINIDMKIIDELSDLFMGLWA